MGTSYGYPPRWTNFTGTIPERGLVDEGLIELIKAIRNRCNVLLAVQGFDDLQGAIPTLLEDLHEDSQAIMDEYCIDGWR